MERPFDRGDLELQQGFFDLVGIDRHGERLTFRFGRQELPLGSGRLVSLRDAANVRLTFDAAKLIWNHGEDTLEAFAGRPVEPRLGVFSSAPSGRESFWAIDWTAPHAVASSDRVDDPTHRFQPGAPSARQSRPYVGSDIQWCP